MKVQADPNPEQGVEGARLCAKQYSSAQLLFYIKIDPFKVAQGLSKCCGRETQ